MTARNNCAPTTDIVLEDSDMAGMCDIERIDISDSSLESAITVTIFFSDIHNNPLPAGTKVSVMSDNAVLTGLTDYTVINTAQRVPDSVSVNITKEAEPNEVDSGFLYIEFETPGGVKTQLPVMEIEDEPKV